MVSPMGRPERVSPSSGYPLPGHGTWITRSHNPDYTALPPSVHTTPHDVYYPSHAFPRQTNHQQRKPTRPPTTTTAATEIPAMAPLLRPPLLTEGSAGLTAGVCVT